MRRLLLLVVAAVSVFSGCGGTGRGIGATAPRSLEPTIAEVRAAAEARQPDTVRAKLGELREQVKALREQGTLDEVEAARLLAAAGDVEENLTLITTTTAQPRPPTTVPRPATTRQPAKKDQEEKPDDDGNRKDEENKEDKD